MEDLCISQPCKNEGTCNVSNDGYKCICPTGLKGTNCEEGESKTSAGIFTAYRHLCGSGSGLMVSALDSGPSNFCLRRSHCVVVLGKILYSNSTFLNSGV